MEIRFEGASIIVTGGSKGIGGASATVLAVSGAQVTVFDVDRAAGEQLAATHERITFETVDVTDEAAVNAAIEHVAATHGSIDGLVNNAGIAPALTIDDIGAADWERVLQVNLTGAYNCARAVTRYMKAARSGSIVNVASVAGKNISLGAGMHYTTSKWGLIGFSRHLGYELAPFGIRVNVVCPGPTLTDLLKSDDDSKRAAVSGFPLGRWIEPDDVANAIAFFLSPLSAMCTGAELVVDGGALLGSGDQYERYYRARGAEMPERDLQLPEL